MANKLIMPGDGALNPFTIPGTNRRYSCAAGSNLVVPDFDADILIMNGWVNSIASGAAGTTAQRPTSPTKGQAFNDTTVGAAVVWAGPKTGWLHHATGAST